MNMEQNLDLAYILGYITPDNDTQALVSFLKKDYLSFSIHHSDLVDRIKSKFNLAGDFYIFRAEELELIYRKITRNGYLSGMPLAETPEDEYLAYIFGVITRVGGINIREEGPELIIPHRMSKQIVDDFLHYLQTINIAFDFGIGNTIVIRGINAIDFLGKVHALDIPSRSLAWKAQYDLARNFNKRDAMANCLVEYTPKLKVAKKDPNAIIPTKNKESDAGIDITVISVKKTSKTGCLDVIYYDTGLIIEPDPGYYFEIVPRSSISKTGYMLANSVGIIDSSYRGTLLVVLVKIDPKADDLALPCRIAQLIPRRVIPVDVEEISLDNMTRTSRGEGGFGSSG